jgi:hypothetical protein
VFYYSAGIGEFNNPALAKQYTNKCLTYINLKPEVGNIISLGTTGKPPVL